MIFCRPLSEQDRELVSAWLAQDELHQQLGLKFEDVTAQGSESYVISDAQGPIMAIRTQKALRVAIQFNPASPYRSAAAAPEILTWLKELASTEKCTEIVIRPGGKAVKFAEKLKFLPFIGKYIEVK